VVEPFRDSGRSVFGVDCQNAVHVEIAVPDAVRAGVWACSMAVVSPPHDGVFMPLRPGP
jgi:hypothetical protein